MKKAAVIGAGAWGTTLGLVLCDNGYDVTLIARDGKTLSMFREARCIPRLPGVLLPQNMTCSNHPEEVLPEANIVVSAIPSHALRSVIPEMAPMVADGSILVSATKGFDEESLMRPTEMWVRYRRDLEGRIAAISGPNFAVEIARKLPAATVVASASEAAQKTAQDAFMTRYFRVYTHWDVVGVELGGALKNIIALACGMAEGLGLGYNAQAAIISRGIAEITRLGVAMGAAPLTFSGLSGLGDLVLTCTGNLSRNRQAGMAVAKGESAEEFSRRTGLTVEGFLTVKAAVRLADSFGVSMPISQTVNKILYQGARALDALEEMMNRERKPEHESFPLFETRPDK